MWLVSLSIERMLEGQRLLRRLPETAFFASLDDIGSGGATSGCDPSPLAPGALGAFRGVKRKKGLGQLKTQRNNIDLHAQRVCFF